MMASPICIEFIDQALSNHTPFPLSYGDPHQKWLIRTHILSLLLDHPAFSPSFGTFTHDNGAAAHLLCLSGPLRSSSSAAAVPLTIWLHENHPLMAPIVYVDDSDVDRIRGGHPFVALCGRVACPYLQTWSHPSCSLSELVRNLGRLFSRDHPFTGATAAFARHPSSCCHPSLVSKREALDRLAGSIHYDIAAVLAEARGEIDALWWMREEVVERGRAGRRAVSLLEEEKRWLKEAAGKLADQADVAVNWLRVNDRESMEAAIGGERVEEAFEVAEKEKEKAVVEWVAAERGIDDVMYALDRAVEEGLVSFEAYMKQVRVLAREQFIYRAKVVKLRGSSML